MTLATPALDGKRLLVVEDETLVAMMLEDMLCDFGCSVAGVAGTLSGGLALAANDALPLDGAILDVNLGGELVYPVAEQLVRRGVPFVFCTGYGAGGVSEAFIKVPTLAKPYRSEDLKGLLTSMLGG